MKMYRPHRLCPRNSKPKEPSLYRSLCVSILCMFLSTVMLVGTTMAWFSDSLQTGVYTITSANFTVTTFFCTDLADGSGTNNWQLLNPGNTTLFGGGSLSSGGSQVAYLKLVNNSKIPLKYTFTLTASGESGNIGDLSLAGCQTKTENGESFALIESDLKAIDLSAITPGSDLKTVVFDVPAAPGSNNPVIVYAVLKLTYTSSNEASNVYSFSLKVESTQTDPNAQATESPITSTSVDMTFTGDTPSTPDTTTSDAANRSDEVLQPSVGEDNSGSNHTETPSGSTTGAEGTTGTSESGTSGTTSGTGTTGTTGTTSGASGGTGAPVSEPQAEVPTT